MVQQFLSLTFDRPVETHHKYFASQGELLQTTDTTFNRLVEEGFIADTTFLDQVRK